MAAKVKEEFARLLLEGVYRIKLHEAKPLQIIQDQLGYAIGREGGSAIAHWRRGHVPARLEDLENLAREITRRGRLDRNWLEQFLMHGRHPDPSQLADELFSANGNQATVTAVNQPPNKLPDKNYRTLVGRDSLVDEIGRLLGDRDGRWLVGIDGQGGIGKTALARGVSERCREQGQFEAILWISASRTDLPGAFVPEGGLTFERLLDAVSAQLRLPELSKLPLQQKIQRLQALLRHRRLLFVLDNLETAVDPQAEIIEQLRPFLNPSKVLLTSRHRFRGDLYAVHLDGLDDEGGLQFIRQDAAEKGIEHVASAAAADLLPIIEATGGSPLALKLVVSQLAHFDLSVVLQNLIEVKTQENGPSEYTRFYKYVYGRSWSLLTVDSQQLLLALANFTPGIGGDFKAIQHVSDLPIAALSDSIDALWQLSFLEIGEPVGLNQMRYYLHPLTQHFILSDII